jgi:hypothetical protein
LKIYYLVKPTKEVQSIDISIRTRICEVKRIEMNKNIQKLKKEIFDAVINNMEEKDAEAIIERSVNMTLRYIDTQVSTHKFFKDD